MSQNSLCWFEHYYGWSGKLRCAHQYKAQLFSQLNGSKLVFREWKRFNTYTHTHLRTLMHGNFVLEISTCGAVSPIHSYSHTLVRCKLHTHITHLSHHHMERANMCARGECIQYGKSDVVVVRSKSKTINKTKTNTMDFRKVEVTAARHLCNLFALFFIMFRKNFLCVVKYHKTQHSKKISSILLFFFWRKEVWLAGVLLVPFQFRIGIWNFDFRKQIGCLKHIGISNHTDISHSFVCLCVSVCMWAHPVHWAVNVFNKHCLLFNVYLEKHKQIKHFHKHSFENHGFIW